MFNKSVCRRLNVAAILVFVLLIISIIPVNAAKNVIIMIGDGMGFKHLEATRNYLGTQLVMDAFPVKLAATTYLYGGSYNPASAATTFSYLSSGATDSAAAATALSTGVKVNAGNLCTDNGDVNRLKNMTEYAKMFNKAAGTITTVPFSHATPAGFASHNNDRGNLTAIAREMITSLGDGTGERGNTPTIDVIIGGGQNTVYIGTDEYNALKNGTTGQGWTFVEKTTGVNGGTALFNVSQTSTKLFALFGGGNDGDLPYRMANGSGQIMENPTLAQMSQAALNVLSKDPDGFFLMIEGGMIDHASHSNLMDQMIGETIGFNEAVSAVVSWINTNDPTWENTLLVVTADHETGYLTHASGTLPNVALGNPGAGIVPTSGTHYYWNSVGHSNSIVPVFAKGAGSEMLTAYATSHDTLYNIDYLDNTDIFKTLYRSTLPVSTLDEARSAGNNDPVSMAEATVTASYSDAFWVENYNRSSGIKVISTANPPVGKKVFIAGRIVKSNNEAAVQAQDVVVGGGDAVPPPVIVTGKAAGELDKAGAAAQGLLVKVAGNVTGVTTDNNNRVTGYYLDDGSGLAGDGIHKGLYVIVDPAWNTSSGITNTFRTAYGPLTVATVGGNVIPAVKDSITLFTAYNDCVWATGQPSTNITTFNIGASSPGPTSGFLKDFDTGATTNVTATMSQYGTVNWQSSISTGGSDCAAGTDAAALFGGKVSLIGVIYYGATGWYVDVTFTGLDPNGKYEFATTANRTGGSTYLNRLTKYTILSALQFTNTSSIGTTIGDSGASTTLCTGENTATGYIARWTNIKPSAAGSFVVRAQAGSTINNAYSFDAFMLKRLQ